MAYTVQQLAKISHVSVRTLHYYDEIDLLKPSYVGLNGYRYYEQKKLLKLQQILFFRELDFSLEQMKQMFASPHFDQIEALKDQKKLLTMKRDRLNKLLLTIQNTMNSLKKSKKMKAEKMYDAFTEQEMEQYKEEARQRWGHTKAYKQSTERTKHWTKKDYDRVKEEGETLIRELVAAMPKGIESDEVQKLVVRHRKGIEQFYDCSDTMYRALGKMYVEDQRFTAYYDRFKPGLAQFLHKAIEYHCDQHE